MQLINPDKTIGTFRSRGSDFSFMPFYSNLDSHLVLDYMCKQGNYIYYNDGLFKTPKQFKERLKSGFYDNSFIIRDIRTRQINSILVYYPIDQFIVGASIMFIEGRRCSVPVDFGISYWHQHMDILTLACDTKVKFIQQLCFNKYEAFDMGDELDEKTYFFYKQSTKNTTPIWIIS